MLASAPYHQHSEHNFSYDMRAPEWSKFIANSFSNSISLCMFWKLQRLQEWLGRGIAQNDKSASNSEADQLKLTKLDMNNNLPKAYQIMPHKSTSASTGPFPWSQAGDTKWPPMRLLRRWGRNLGLLAKRPLRGLLAIRALVSSWFGPYLEAYHLHIINFSIFSDFFSIFRLFVMPIGCIIA